MEFPHLGEHCSKASCNRLDFLPMKCDSCNQVFCSGHFSYERHDCHGAHRKDVQVPVCPLCGEPVPTPPGMAPDLTVGQHMDKKCKSDTKKIFINRCTFENCKRKELIPLTCTQCRRNFCLRHRHTADHNCDKKPRSTFMFMGEEQRRALTANAAEYRRTNKPTTLFNTNLKPNVGSTRGGEPTHGSNQIKDIQGNMSEDEALARALALSIMELDANADRNRRIEAARRSNETVPVGGRDRQQNAKDKCSLS